MESVVKVAATIEEAVEEGLKELNISREYAEIEVIEEPSRGILGLIGTRDAIVRITSTFDPRDKINEFLDKVLNTLGLDSTNRIEIKDGSIYVEITGVAQEDMGIIIGRRGSTLDDMQYLLNLIVNKDTENYMRVVLDINDYRAKREETLIDLAGKMANKAKRIKRLVKLEPMNPYERKIIHSALQVDEEIETYSQGEEPYRRIVIKVKR